MLRFKLVARQMKQNQITWELGQSQMADRPQHGIPPGWRGRPGNFGATGLMGPMMDESLKVSTHPKTHFAKISSTFWLFRAAVTVVFLWRCSWGHPAIHSQKPHARPRPLRIWLHRALGSTFSWCIMPLPVELPTYLPAWSLRADAIPAAGGPAQHLTEIAGDCREQAEQYHCGPRRRGESIPRHPRAAHLNCSQSRHPTPPQRLSRLRPPAHATAVSSPAVLCFLLGFSGLVARDCAIHLLARWVGGRSEEFGILEPPATGFQSRGCAPATPWCPWAVGATADSGIQRPQSGGVAPMDRE